MQGAMTSPLSVYAQVLPASLLLRHAAYLGPQTQLTTLLKAGGCHAEQQEMLQGALLGVAKVRNRTQI